MTTTVTKLRIAKTEPTPHKILRVEYGCALFLDSFLVGGLPTAFPPLFTPFFSATGLIPSIKLFLCLFVATMGCGAVAGRTDLGNGQFIYLNRQTVGCKYPGLTLLYGLNRQAQRTPGRLKPHWSIGLFSPVACSFRASTPKSSRLFPAMSPLTEAIP